jgi:cytochrome c oxidase subunit 4
MEQMKSETTILSYRTYISVWIGLLVLMSISLLSAGLKLGAWSVLTVLFIASLKAGLVVSFFMHLKYERRLFKIMLLFAITTITVIIGLTFADIWYR